MIEDIQYDNEACIFIIPQGSILEEMIRHSKKRRCYTNFWRYFSSMKLSLEKRGKKSIGGDNTRKLF